MLDDVEKLRLLGPSLEDITSFEYLVSIPRSNPGPSARPRNPILFNYNLVMLACVYVSPNVLAHVYDHYVEPLPQEEKE